MSDLEGFAAAGEMSLRDACLVVFRELKPGDWIERSQLAHDVRQLTGVDSKQDAIEGAAWRAREALAKSEEIGVEFFMNGFKRLTAIGQYDASVKRLKKARRSVKRMLNWTGAALRNGEITGAERHHLEAIQTISFRQGELEERRAKRRRPLPPSSAEEAE